MESIISATIIISPALASCILAVRKVLGLTDMNWVWVTSPLWIMALVIIGLFAYVTIIGCDNDLED